MTALRRAAKKAWVVLLDLSGALALARRRLSSDGSIVVLMFHRVLRDDDFERTNSLPGMVMRERTFAALVEHAAQNADVLPAGEARPGTAGRKPRLVFTFDDGWIDNAEVAFPIASRRRVPFTIFVCPGLMDTPEPFWTERAIAASGVGPRDAGPLIERLKRLPPTEREVELSALPDRSGRAVPRLDRTMSWDDARRLQGGGVSFGSHSFMHEILTFLSERDLADDLRRARACIREALGGECALLAYPNGNVSDLVAAGVGGAGHALAFTTRPSVWTRETPQFHVPRVNIWEGTVAPWDEGFSRRAFDYAVYWGPFLTWVRDARGLGRLRRFFGI